MASETRLALSAIIISMFILFPVLILKTGKLLNKTTVYNSTYNNDYDLITDAIDCFKCVSMNGTNAACDDPFHNNHSTDILESPCMGGRKGRDGYFPATSCIKIAGIYG